MDQQRENLRVIRDNLTSARERLERARENVRERPFGLLVTGIAVGSIIGLVLPVKRFETKRIGPISEDVKSRMRERPPRPAIKETIESVSEAAVNPGET